MINLVDRAIERFLRERVPLPEDSVGLAFDAPDSAWGAALNRPTVNVFLWDICRAGAAQASTGLAERRGANGMSERRPASPVVDFNYLVTGWASEMRDEHQLLGLILKAVLTHPRLPEGYLADGVASGSCTLSLAGADEPTRGDLWSALGGKLKPALKLRLSVPFDVFGWQTAATPVTAVELKPDMFEHPPRATGTGSTGGPEPSALRRQRRNGALIMEGVRPQGPPGGGPDPDRSSGS